MESSSDFFAVASSLEFDPLARGETTEIRFSEFRACPETIGNSWTNKLDAVGQVILGVCFFDQNNCCIIGTATMVATGIAVTAFHVIEEFIDRVTHDQNSALLFGFSKGQIIIWKIASITRINDSDLAILSLALASEPPPENIFEIPVISLRLPRLEEMVLILGFRAIDARIEKGSIWASFRLFHSVGRVTQHFLEGRGTMLPGSHVAVGCNTPGGLSGGAAFDRHGNLIGFLSSSMEHDDGEGPSFVSLAIPALVQPFPVYWLTKEPGSQKTRLIDIDHGFCNLDQRDSISATTDPKTGATALIYDDGME